MVPELGGQSTVVDFEKDLQDETGKQLRLREFFGTETMCVQSEAMCANGQGLSSDPQG
jgi:hypothetical protein